MTPAKKQALARRVLRIPTALLVEVQPFRLSSPIPVVTTIEDSGPVELAGRLVTIREVRSPRNEEG